MDHFYQQKLINEKNHLQRQLIEAERKLKNLTEQVGDYERLVSLLKEGAAERANDAGLARLQRKSGIDLGVKTTHREGEGVTPAGEAAQERRMRQQEIGRDKIQPRLNENNWQPGQGVPHPDRARMMAGHDWKNSGLAPGMLAAHLSGAPKGQVTRGDMRAEEGIHRLGRVVKPLQSSPPTQKELAPSRPGSSLSKNTIKEATTRLDELISPAQAAGPRRALAIHQAARLERIRTAHNARSNATFEAERAAHGDGRGGYKGLFSDKFVQGQFEKGRRIAALAHTLGANAWTHPGARGTVTQGGPLPSGDNDRDRLRYFQKGSDEPSPFNRGMSLQQQGQAYLAADRKRRQERARTDSPLGF